VGLSKSSIYHPYIEVNEFKDSVQVCFGGLRVKPGKSSSRGRITEWSRKSQKHMNLALREVKDIMKNMVRLSYPADFPCDGRIVAKHRDVFLKRLRRRGIRYFWWLEFQERGAPHLHLFIDKDIPKEELSRIWFDVVGSGDLNHLAYGTRIGKIRSKEKAIGYAMSYAKKESQKVVPDGYENVGRFWGTSEKIKPVGVYKLKFNNENERARWLRPLRKWYQAKMKEWSLKTGKRYKWRMRNQGFMVWDGREAWEQFINQKIQDKEKEPCQKEAG